MNSFIIMLIKTMTDQEKKQRNSKPLAPTFEEMKARFPGGYTIALVDGEKCTQPENATEYDALLKTGRAYQSSYTHVWLRTTPFSGPGPYTLHSYCNESTWFTVRLCDRVVYIPT